MAKNYLLSILLLAIFLAINLLVVYHFNLYPLKWVIHTHIFFFVLLVLIIAIFTLMVKIRLPYSGYTFIGMALFKMLLVLIVLYFFNLDYGKQTYFVLNFTIVYLLYLFFSIFLGLRSLKFFTSK